MSTAPENEFDLEKLFLPAWAQEPSSAKYAKYEGEDRPDQREDRPRGRSGRREGGRPARRDEHRPREGQRDQNRPRGERRGPARPEGRSKPGEERPAFRRGQRERRATEPPKGKYTVVAQCGLSGVILGPPNYHDYQNQLRKLHSERFSRMPFDVYKSRVKIVRDEEVVKKWIDEQSWKVEYLCLNLPEPLRLGSMEAVEKHFREQHKENIIKPVNSHTLSGTAARGLRSPELLRLIRSVWEDQRRFPLQIATVLSQQFAGHGLQFFKVNKTITHVSVARPHYLDLEATPVSEGVKRIVDYINANPKSTRRKLVEALAPSPVPAEPPSVPAAEAAQTPEQTAIVADLHWLIHQGHVIEFANGTLETAKKPLPRPPKPELKSPPQPAPLVAEHPPTAPLTSVPVSEAASAPAAESIVVEPVPPSQP